MNEISSTEIATRAIADAVTTALHEDPKISASDLSALAVSAAQAIAAGFAAFSVAAGLSAPRS